MKKSIFFALFLGLVQLASAQKTMSPELLWELGRVSPVGITTDQKHLIYSVTTPNAEKNDFDTKHYKVSIDGGEPQAIEDYKSLLTNAKISPDGSKEIYSEPVKIENVLGSDYYPELTESNVYIYTDLDYRSWDTWNDGKYNHVHFKNTSKPETAVDIMAGEPHNSPGKPFGGSDEFIWTPDGAAIIYVSKKVSGVESVTSTNSDLYRFDLKSGKTTNLTEGMMGYDSSPSFAENGTLAWLSMARDGYESDKNDLYIQVEGTVKNITEKWDGTVRSYMWGNKGKTIFFTAAVDGTVQLFKVDNPGLSKKIPTVEQLTSGVFDVNGPIAQVGNRIFVTRSDMNHANEIYTYDLKRKIWKQITHVNDEHYAALSLSKIEARQIKTTDGKDMLTWVIYPPNFDPNKKYPTLLYLQGGPQGALSQFYSFRWNFQIMAAHGYIVVAPNRRGMPGHGVEWNEQISKDWGGQAMKDYLSAIDAMAKEPFVDEDRLGAVGASFGGYSAFYLAGHHEGRFKTFIAHDGVFNLQSMYGTTEELFFVNWDMGGPYWEKDNKAAQKTYTDFNPINFVDRWDTPILIYQGGKDFRVPIGQSLEAFQAAQVRGIKSKLVYLPDENHWVLQPQNGLIWQREFFNWLKETL